MQSASCFFKSPAVLYAQTFISSRRKKLTDESREIEIYMHYYVIFCYIFGVSINDRYDDDDDADHDEYVIFYVDTAV